MNDRILVCDPNQQVQRALRVILREAGYTVVSTVSGRSALAWMERIRPRAVILELLLPDMPGIEACRRLREGGDMPILVLSTLDEDQAKIDALESGADDYITKPFSPGELVARLAARLRAAPAPLRFETDGLVIDFTAHRTTLAGKEVHLTSTEFELLRVLATSRGTVTYNILATKVWGLHGADLAPRIRSHVASLRAKLDPDQRRHLIETEVGIGYRFAERTRRPSVPLRRTAAGN